MATLRISLDSDVYEGNVPFGGEELFALNVRYRLRLKPQPVAGCL